MTERVGVSELKKRCLPRIFTFAISKEHVIFAKMLYRAKNQQRHDLSFQKMTGVSRKLKKYLATGNLQQKLKMLIKELFSLHASLPVSTVESVEELFCHLLEAATFTADLLQFIEETWSEVNQRLEKALFVPFNTVMLASLSRIWVCMRYHLVAIAETYNVLKNTVPQAKTPLSYVVLHLRKDQRRYLGTSALCHLRPPPKPADEQSPSVEQSSDNLLLATNTVDTGVAVTLSEEKMLARARDFQTSSNTVLTKPPVILGAQPGSELQSTSVSTTDGCEGCSTVNRKSETSRKEKNRLRKRKRRKLLKRLHKKSSGKQRKNELSHHKEKQDEPLIQTSVSPNSNGDSGKQQLVLPAGEPTSSTTPSTNGKKKQKSWNRKWWKQKSRRKAKRLQERGDESASLIHDRFRLAVVRKNGVEKLIFGKKTLAAILARKKAARQKKIAKAALTPTGPNTLTSTERPAAPKLKYPCLSASPLIMATSAPVQNSTSPCSTMTSSSLLGTPASEGKKDRPASAEMDWTSDDIDGIFSSLF